jgi:dienelactone hydrolase
MRRLDIQLPAPDGHSNGTLHVPDGDGPRPGVLVFPDAGGARETFRQMGDRLATTGYVAPSRTSSWRDRKCGDPRSAPPVTAWADACR